MSSLPKVWVPHSQNLVHLHSSSPTTSRNLVSLNFFVKTLAAPLPRRARNTVFVF